MSRWPRFVELFERSQSGGGRSALATFTEGDWGDLQVLSQLAWMDEEWLASEPVVSRLSRKGSNFTEKDKQQLRSKQLEFLAGVLPEYRRAAESGQIEISTTPFYHPILPLLCDSDIARTANPWTPLPNPPFRYPEDARERSEEHTSELQSQSNLVCRLLLEKKNQPQLHPLALVQPLLHTYH